jgi:hypothetical protein
MNVAPVRERVKKRPVVESADNNEELGVMKLNMQVLKRAQQKKHATTKKTFKTVKKDRPHEKAAQERLTKHTDDKRFQHELKEMQETHDLDDVDDDVEAEATLFEWYAKEHEHRPKSPVWFVALASGTTAIVGIQLFLYSNFIGAITIAAIGGLMYFIAQQKPPKVRYRIMIDGIAINNLLYHYQDLETFNVIYEPNETQTIIFRTNRRFSPYVHLEIGEADVDPSDIRDILMEFLEEDQEMEEPLVDILARRLGF